MDSEQMQHRLNLNTSSTGANLTFKLDSHSSLPPTPNQIDPQYRSPQSESDLGNELSTDDIWKNDSAQQERKLLAAIANIKQAQIDDKLEFKKQLADLYKQANCLMTIYNQRVQNLLLDDRFLHRHASEISALLIRGLMPPLEEVKSIEKSLTSTRKKSDDETIEQQTTCVVKEMVKVETICKDAKARITKYCRLPKPAKVTSTPPAKKLDEKSISLTNAIKQVNPAPFQQKAGAEQQTVKKEFFTPEKPVIHKQLQPESSGADRINSRELKSFAEDLLSSGTANQRALSNFIQQEYQKYIVIEPLLSVARQKCSLLSMRSDKVCVACDNALAKLNDYQSCTAQPVSLEQLQELDNAVSTLEKFDRKLPGEVWQLLTELKPATADHRHHLLNLQCRKLLSDGPATITQKSELSYFKEVEKYLNLFIEKAAQATFEEQFITVFEGAFDSASQLKKVVTMANKPQELLALISIFQNQNPQAAEQEYLSGEVQAKLQAEAQHFRISEPSSTFKELKQSLWSSFNAALEYSGSVNIKEPITELAVEEELADNTATSNFVGILKKHHQNDKDAPLKQVFDAIEQAQSLDTLQNYNRLILKAVLSARLESDAVRDIIPHWLKMQSHMLSLEDTKNLEASGNGFCEIPEQVQSAINSLEENSPAKWFNQIFNTSVKEYQLKVLELMKSIMPLWANAIALKPIKITFLDAVATEIEPQHSDAQIDDLCTALRRFEV